MDEKVDFAHSVVGPAMYQFSSGSYYSESEYSLQGDEWGERFWGRETYNQLLKVRENLKQKVCPVRNGIEQEGYIYGQISELKTAQVKKTWDPEHIFSCRHCIGDGKAAMHNIDIQDIGG